MKNLKKTVLITGSTSGIGLRIATEFAKVGYNIALHGLDDAGFDIAIELRTEYKVKTNFSKANLKNSNEIVGFINDIENNFGHIDILINNAGIQFVSPIEDFPVSQWDDVLAINLSAAFHTSRTVWKGMKEQGFGRIINIASAHGLRASEYKSAYVAAKHGLIGLTKVLALEGAPYGITVNAICPGYVKTPLIDTQIKNQSIAHHISEEKIISDVLLKKQAIKQFISAESIAAMALFLSSNHGTTITGAALSMDGGWTAQ